MRERLVVVGTKALGHLVAHHLDREPKSLRVKGQHLREIERKDDLQAGTHAACIDILQQLRNQPDLQVTDDRNRDINRTRPGYFFHRR